jgi:hypothetical protein
MTLSTKILKLPLALLAACLMPLLASCESNDEGLATASRPEIARLQPPARVDVPEPAATCPLPDGTTEPCYSDTQIGEMLRTLEREVDTRDRMLCWLLAFHGYPACQANP